MFKVNSLILNRIDAFVLENNSNTSWWSRR